MNVAIILAAGESRRMGQPKQLLPFAGQTMLGCVIDALQSPRVDEIRVVLGYKADEIARRIESQAGTVAPLKIVKNDHYQQGMFTSMQAGLRDLPKATKIVMLAVCDQPRLKRETVETLIETFEKDRHKILIPSFNGRQGHPPLLRAEYAKEILAMDESMTLKHFYAKRADDIARLVVEDEGVLIDIDDPITYRKQLKAVAGGVLPRYRGLAKSVVGREAPRGAGVDGKFPQRLRRLKALWVGEGFPCFFLTICVQGRVPVLANDTIHRRLREFLVNSPRRRGWWPSQYVIMPDHLHLLLRRSELPRGATRPTTLGNWVKALKAVVGGRAVKWQKGFFDHVLRSEESEAEKWEYIRQNPVRAGLVERPEDWIFAGEITYDGPPRGATRPTTE